VGIIHKDFTKCCQVTFLSGREAVQVFIGFFFVQVFLLFDFLCAGFYFFFVCRCLLFVFFVHGVYCFGFFFVQIFIICFLGRFLFFVFIHSVVYDISIVLIQISWRKSWDSINDLLPPHCCDCPKQWHGFASAFFVVFPVFRCWWNCLSSLLKIYVYNWYNPT